MSFRWKSDTVKNNLSFYLHQFYFKENRFHAVYFVDSITGSLLLSKRYSKISTNISETDDDLISNFLNAINLFIKEIRSNKEEEIQEINFKDSRILYEKKGRLLCVGITKKTDIKIERAILHHILEDFYQQFKNEIEEFKGYIIPEILNYRTRLDIANVNALNNMDRRL